MRTFLARLARARDGMAIVEFALVSPVLLMLIMGFGDLLYQGYIQSVLNAAVQKAARDSGLEGGDANATAIDNRVRALVRTVVANATIPTPTRKSYDSFSEVAPEPFTDTNGNGIRDAGECFTDVNRNGVWDADPGTSGQGGASAVVLYTVTVTYPRLFPVAGLIGLPNTQTISATTLLRNQPYLSQATTTPQTVCT